MAKKKSKKRKAGNRIDIARHGVNLPRLLDEIADDLKGTNAEIGERAGIPALKVSHLLNGHAAPSLGYICLLAKAAGGRVVVKYEPKRKR